MKLVSLIVPIYNEEDNIKILLKNISKNLNIKGYKFEIIIVDDGSTDNSYQILNTERKIFKNIKILKLMRNFGQTAALAAGTDCSKGEIIITMDGDNQNDPSDIKNLLKKIENNYDLVSGWRKNRKDNFLSRILLSKIANYLISKISGVKLNDYGCTLKAYNARLLKNIVMYGEMHRFIPIYIKWLGGKITEIPVNHYPRKYGKTKYGLSRVYKVFSDIILILLIDKYFTKPMHLFGGFSIINFIFGIIFFILMIYIKYSSINLAFHKTPLPSLVVLFILISILSLLLGFIAEILIRSFYSSKKENKPYIISENK
tara:strand:- start:345 stop:1289 length:945 start_codon:yes stop_codon:yes gene_type:complete